MGQAQNKKLMIGMVHVRALPGTPHASLLVPEVISKAVEEARVLLDCGFDGLLIENMHDTPYLLRKVGPEVVACMTAVGCAIRQAFPTVLLGVQVLAGANHEALAVALACGAQFIRCEGFVFASVADEGLMAKASAGELLRYRRAIGCGHIKIAADIKKKHSAHAITSDVSIAETAHAAEFFCADAVIVTGVSTGQPTELDDVVAAKRATKLPVAVGSGVTPSNLRILASWADIFIVGSYIKKDGNWANDIDPARCKEIVEAAKNRA